MQAACAPPAPATPVGRGGACAPPAAPPPRLRRLGTGTALGLLLHVRWAPPPPRHRAVAAAAAASSCRAGGAAGGEQQPGTVRINKCFREFASRREADRFVEEGRVRVNGAMAAPGQRVARGDRVTLDGRAVRWEALQSELAAGGEPEHEGPKASGAPGPGGAGGTEAEADGGADADGAPLPLESSHVYVKYWKPRGVVCTTDERVAGAVTAAVRHPSGRRLFPVGRLDKDSTGLLLLSSDGRLPNAALRAKHARPKAYRVTAHAPPSDADVARLAAGVVITTEAQRDRGVRRALTAATLPCRVERDAADASGRTLLFELREGRNRQIRRMLGALGLETLALQRTAFLGIGLAGLRPGEWRELDDAEMREVRRAVRAAERSERVAGQAAGDGGDAPSAPLAGGAARGHSKR